MYHLPIVIVKSSGSDEHRYADILAEFTSKHVCEGAVDALQLLEESPAHLVIAELSIKDMNAVELAEVIRDIDSERDHFTYIILTGESIDDRLREAFREEIDAFVPAGQSDTLLNCVQAGMRISSTLNELRQHNRALVRERDLLREGQLLDPLTGLGNARLAEHALADTIKQIESRGGAVCYLLMTFGNREEVIDTYDHHIADELVIAIAQRLKSLVRPMDTVCHLGEGKFALILLQPSVDQCTAQCYNRIFDGIRLKSFRTAAGYLDVTVGMTLCASHAETGPPNPETMARIAESHLQESVNKQQIIVEHLAE